MNLFRSHGVTRDQSLITKRNAGPWYYQQIDLGFNYRMTELQAVLGISQMKKLDEFVLKRHILQEKYDTLLASLPVIRPYQNQDSYSALHLYPIQIDLEKVSKSRKQVFDELIANGIGVNVHYIPIYKQPFYEAIGFDERNFPESERYYSEAITLPMYPELSNKKIKYISSVLEKALQ